MMVLRVKIANGGRQPGLCVIPNCFVGSPLGSILQWFQVRVEMLIYVVDECDHGRMNAPKRRPEMALQVQPCLVMLFGRE